MFVYLPLEPKKGLTNLKLIKRKLIMYSIRQLRRIRTYCIQHFISNKHNNYTNLFWNRIL